MFRNIVIIKRSCYKKTEHYKRQWLLSVPVSPSKYIFAASPDDEFRSKHEVNLRKILIVFILEAVV
jgi:hypothetical protein